MSSKKWLLAFTICIFLTAAVVATLNWVTDPFGVFGDKNLNWYSFNFTNNPRAAKIAYLDQHADEFDSYLIGCSSTSSFSVERLNKYMNARFYNLFMYGADTYDTLETARYVLENYETRNLVLNLSILNAYYYNYENDPLTDSLHAKVDGSSLPKFYLKYLFANPRYALNKVDALRKDSYLPKTFDVFDVKTGSYNKCARDIEPIGNMPAYLEAYPVFANYPSASYNLPQTENCLASVAKIKHLCEEKGVNFILVFSPLYVEHASYFNEAEVNNFLTRLTQVSDFWDFSLSSVSDDPRYFYDATHFRNCVGDMALARIFGDDSIYIPSDFGVLVTADNAAELWSKTRSVASGYTAQVPILMYHHLSEGEASSTVIPVKTFASHLQALQAAGYNTISLSQLKSFVENGDKLPKNPVVITFDDGYESNYSLAYPLLKKYNMKATIFVIGSSIGKDTYKDTDYPITPHFSYDQAQEMIASGLVEIQCHTYDMHQWQDYEQGVARETISMLEGESEEDYIAVFRNDFEIFRKELQTNTESQVFAFSYPKGEYNTLAAVLLNEAGVTVTLTTEPGTNTVIKGLPQSLLGLHRYGVNGNMSAAELLDLIS